MFVVLGWGMTPMSSKGICWKPGMVQAGDVRWSLRSSFDSSAKHGASFSTLLSILNLPRAPVPPKPQLTSFVQTPICHPRLL